MNKMYSNQINRIQLGNKSEQKKQSRKSKEGSGEQPRSGIWGERQKANRIAAFSISRDKAEVPYL